MSPSDELLTPALRAHMGDWVYYITFFSLHDIAKRVRIAEEIHTSTTLNDLIQRQVSRRAREIAVYLQSRQQRFFNALIVGVYGGSPSWYELSVRRNAMFNPDALPVGLRGALGVLKLKGTEKLFAIDGQHRVKRISLALENSGSNGLRDDEVCVILLAHHKTREGMVRTRRYSRP